MPTVFVSHTTADDRDLDLARKLARARQAGAQVWIAPESVPAGAQWRQEIVSGIMDSCSHFLVILSHASLQSEWVTREIELARTRYDRDHSFVVLQVAMGKLSTPLPDVQQVPYLHEFADQLKAVVKAVGLEPEVSKLVSCRSRLPGSSRRAPQALDAGWLVYPRRQAALVGRQTELAALRAFYDDNEQFKWWAIEGPGGGSARAAWTSRACSTWLQAGMAAFFGHRISSVSTPLSGIPMNRSSSSLTTPPPHRMTNLKPQLRVFTGLPASCGTRFGCCSNARSMDSHGGTSSGRKGRTIRSSESVRCTPEKHSCWAASNETRPRRARGLFTGCAAKAGGSAAPERDPFWDHLNTLTDQGRPLFIGIAAAAIDEMGI